MTIYQLKNSDKFIDLIENGTIKVTIKVDIYLNPKYYGKTYDHGCDFTISEHDISKLYDIINQYY